MARTSQSPTGHTQAQIKGAMKSAIGAAETAFGRELNKHLSGRASTRPASANTAPTKKRTARRKASQSDAA